MSIVIILWLLYFISKAILKNPKPKRKPSRQRKTQAVVTYQPKPLTKTEIDRIRREEQRQIKRLQAAEQAGDEFQRIQALRERYLDLLDSLEEERKEATTLSKKNALTQRILSVEGKVINLDSKMAALYNKTNIICA